MAETINFLSKTGLARLWARIKTMVGPSFKAVAISGRQLTFTALDGSKKYVTIPENYTAGTGLSVSNNKIQLQVPVSVENGGTGATTKADIRSNLELTRRPIVIFTNSAANETGLGTINITADKWGSGNTGKLIDYFIVTYTDNNLSELDLAWGQNEGKTHRPKYTAIWSAKSLANSIGPWNLSSIEASPSHPDGKTARNGAYGRTWIRRTHYELESMKTTQLTSGAMKFKPILNAYFSVTEEGKVAVTKDQPCFVILEIAAVLAE